MPILISFLLGVSLLILLGKAQDSLAVYFPDKIPVYASLKADSGIVNNKFYQRLSQIFEQKQLLDELMKELYPDTKNLAIGVYGTAKQPLYVVAMHLKENAEIAPFEAIMRDYQWSSYVITRKVSGSKILLLSNDFQYIEGIRKTYGFSTSSFVALQSISLNEILSKNDGVLQIRPNEITALLPVFSEVNDTLATHQIAKLRFGINLSKKQGNLIFSNLMLEPLDTLKLKKPGTLNRAFALGHVDGVLKNLLDGVRQRYQTQNSVLSMLSAYESARPDTLSYYDYNDGEISLSADWKNGVPVIVRKQLIETLQDLLANGHSLEKTVYLPDGSPITALVKNTEASKVIENGNLTTIQDLVTGQDFNLKTEGSKLTLTKGKDNDSDAGQVEIDGCLADRDVNLALLDIHKLFGVGDKLNIGKLLILEHNMISSTSYPQLSFCVY